MFTCGLQYSTLTRREGGRGARRELLARFGDSPPLPYFLFPSGVRHTRPRKGQQQPHAPRLFVVLRDMRPHGLLCCALMACSIALACSFSLPQSPKPRTWDVVVHHAGKAHKLQVPETQPVLTAVEIAGLLPGSECRRGRCLSCAARVIAGDPFSLRVASDTALCEAAHTEGLVLLCSAFACGPGLELELGFEGEAWDIQHRVLRQSDSLYNPFALPGSFSEECGGHEKWLESRRVCRTDGAATLSCRHLQRVWRLGTTACLRTWPPFLSAAAARRRPQTRITRVCRPTRLARGTGAAANV